MDSFGALREHTKDPVFTARVAPRPPPSVHQGIYTLQLYIRSRIIRVSVADIKVLLTQENPYLSKLEEDAYAQAKKLGETLREGGGSGSWVM